jgi:hypothetical protein
MSSVGIYLLAVGKWIPNKILLLTMTNQGMAIVQCLWLEEELVEFMIELVTSIYQPLSHHDYHNGH